MIHRVQDRTFAGYLAIVDADGRGVEREVKLSLLAAVAYLPRWDAIVVYHRRDIALIFNRHQQFSALSPRFLQQRVRFLNNYGPEGVHFWAKNGILRCDFGLCKDGIYHPIPDPQQPLPLLQAKEQLTFCAGRKRRTIRPISMEDLQ